MENGAKAGARPRVLAGEQGEGRAGATKLSGAWPGTHKPDCGCLFLRREQIAGRSIWRVAN